MRELDNHQRTPHYKSCVICVRFCVAWRRTQMRRRRRGHLHNTFLTSFARVPASVVDATRRYRHLDGFDDRRRSRTSCRCGLFVAAVIRCQQLRQPASQPARQPAESLPVNGVVVGRACARFACTIARWYLSNGRRVM